MRKNVIATGQVLTGNRLDDGAVVFLGRNGQWISTIEGAAIVVEKQAATMLQKRGDDAVASNIVTEAYLIAVADCNGVMRPVARRERIRAIGPSVRLDLARSLNGVEPLLETAA